MKLQLALDVFRLEDALALTEQIKGHIDIIEIGTPFLLEEGMNAVRQFRKTFPDKKIFADTKIMDAGELETLSAIEAGADYITVLAVTDIATVEACVSVANEHGREIVADMICVDDIPSKIARLEAVGVHGIAVHTGVDQQREGRTPLDDLKVMKRHCKNAEVYVAGGISLATVPLYAELEPDVLIVGGAVGSAENPVDEALKLRAKIGK
ncbi:MAG: 3-hexulose-6-phosphate synthase [Spirochaetales bacterium]|uniref:3-hexulose-6-phosphate synthase n=1 Tax=Candidatus Thalassospirochaeta sargassi TaxID=3119039 RepID=A0AAJ1MJ25_9SPIO|nr:3-hexulose-6-phosphate synthase [Spirochaetales bacterium]